jgi:putative PIN family toxin of toxin-antitoxin system
VIVVLDTNVWISALAFAKPNATPTRALEKAMTDDLIATCVEIEEEILRVLNEKFEWDLDIAKLAIDKILARSITVKLKGTVRKCRDPHDDKFLECASLAQADLLIAGDRDLLVLNSYQGTRIITPAQYLSGIGD